jgi:protein-S-isoprenylcysteine O-methyltransferase Ste14
MMAVVILLRALTVLAFAGPMLLVGASGRSSGRTARRRSAGHRTPLMANLAAFGVFFVSLATWSGGSATSGALALALCGSVLAAAGVRLVVRSRAELGAAWSLVAKADDSTGLVTAGPYRLVRHPIYLGLTLLALGQALAFASWPSILIVLFGILPTFAWRARTEEEVLNRTFGERYEAYRLRTHLIVPGLF